MYVWTKNHPGATFTLHEVMHVWRPFAEYFILFLIHNFFVAPFLVYKKKRGTYLVAFVILLMAYMGFRYVSRPDFVLKDGTRVERVEKPRHHQGKDDRLFEPGPPMHWGFDVIGFFTAIMLMGMNIAIKLYFRGEDEEKRFRDIEQKNLEGQLQYLKYQINPHFFMNTLNNIHALIDIDPEKAKDSIVVLSKMMRYILYEGNNPTIPLQKEVEFLKHYISLMRMRYTSKVTIADNLPAIAPEGCIPPLMLITFVENAFKHGISYSKESFINIDMDSDDLRIYFTCSNSKAQEPVKQKGGVGLANVRKRLKLLYHEDYTLHIEQTSDVYTVKLSVPLFLNNNTENNKPYNE